MYNVQQIIPLEIMEDLAAGDKKYYLEKKWPFDIERD
jgi:hypothetical protein